MNQTTRSTHEDEEEITSNNHKCHGYPPSHAHALFIPMNAVMVHRIALHRPPWHNRGLFTHFMSMFMRWAGLGWAGLGELSAVNMDVVRPVLLPVTNTIET